jgi:hypothetical protein
MLIAPILNNEAVFITVRTLAAAASSNLLNILYTSIIAAYNDSLIVAKHLKVTQLRSAALLRSNKNS